MPRHGLRTLRGFQHNATVIWRHAWAALNLNAPPGGWGKVTELGHEGRLADINSEPDFEGVASIGLSDSTGLGFGVPDGTTCQVHNSLQALDEFSKVKGKHTSKSGAGFRNLQVDERYT